MNEYLTITDFIRLTTPYKNADEWQKQQIIRAVEATYQDMIFFYSEPTHPDFFLQVLLSEYFFNILLTATHDEEFDTKKGKIWFAEYRKTEETLKKLIEAGYPYSEDTPHPVIIMYQEGDMFVNIFL